jgi:hypothetical protein
MSRRKTHKYLDAYASFWAAEQGGIAPHYFLYLRIFFLATDLKNGKQKIGLRVEEMGV